MEKGVYCILIKLGKNQVLRIGNLGKFKFPKGFYFYTGSAMNSLESRIERHFRKKKRLFWHIDYLLESKYARIISVIKIRTGMRIECKLNEKILSHENAQILVKGFGSSDCNCKSHLIYFKMIEDKYLL